MTIDNYAAACKNAATQQGLDPLTDGLKVAGVPFEVEQTGGFCMVVTVRNASGVVAAICDGEDDADGTRPVWTSAFYPGDNWTECGEGEAERATDLADLIARLEAHATATA